MTTCKTINVPRPKICAGTMDRRISLLRRDNTYTPIGGGEPVYNFVPISERWAAVQTVAGVGQGVARVMGINIEDGATHLFYIRRDPDLEPINASETWVSLDGRYFRLLRSDYINEAVGGVTLLQTTERGPDDFEATQA